MKTANRTVSPRSFLTGLLATATLPIWAQSIPSNPDVVWWLSARALPVSQPPAPNWPDRLGDQLYFAGEAVAVPYVQLFSGAHISGVSAAHDVIASIG